MPVDSIGTCRICLKKNVLVLHFDFYVFGSEGVWMCEQCRNATANFLQLMCAAAGRANIQRAKDKKEE